MDKNFFIHYNAILDFWEQVNAIAWYFSSSQLSLFVLNMISLSLSNYFLSFYWFSSTITNE